MTLDEITIKANELMNIHMPEHVKLGWKFKFCNTSKTIGLCRYSKKLIQFSKCFSHMPDNEIEQVLLHEIAHALVGYGHGHGSVFVQKAIEIGCHDYGHKSKTKTRAEKQKNYVLVYNNRAVKYYVNKPRRNFKHVSIRGDRNSLGKLVLMTYNDFLELLIDEQVAKLREAA